MAEGEHPHDMEPIGAVVPDVERELKLRTPAEGTYLPIALVERQVRLAARSHTDLTALLADVVIACALRMKQPTSPKKLLEDTAAKYPMGDDSWFEKVRPELLKVLRGQGIDVDAWFR